MFKESVFVYDVPNQECRRFTVTVKDTGSSIHIGTGFLIPTAGKSQWIELERSVFFEIVRAYAALADLPAVREIPHA